MYEGFSAFEVDKRNEIGKKQKKKEDMSDVKRLCVILHKSIDQRSALQKQISDDEDKLFMLSLVKDLKDIPPDRKLQAKGEIISVVAKQKTFFPAPSANPYPSPNTNPYYPTNLAYSQTDQQQETPPQLFHTQSSVEPQPQQQQYPLSP
jgi:hypothetical protein